MRAPVPGASQFRSEKRQLDVRLMCGALVLPSSFITIAPLPCCLSQYADGAGLVRYLAPCHRVEREAHGKTIMDRTNWSDSASHSRGSGRREQQRLRAFPP